MADGFPRQTGFDKIDINKIECIYNNADDRRHDDRPIPTRTIF
jgi:hypothetical protein